MWHSGGAYSSLLGLEVCVRLWASLRQNSIRVGAVGMEALSGAGRLGTAFERS